MAIQERLILGLVFVASGPTLLLLFGIALALAFSLPFLSLRFLLSELWAALSFLFSASRLR